MTRRLLPLLALPLLLSACVAAGPRAPGDDLPLIRGAATEAQARRLCGAAPSGQPTLPQDICMRDWMFGSSPNVWF